MATTTNYSWTTPDDTDLVKDGASAIRSLGSAIDTTVFNNASAAVAKSLIDAEGDLIVGDAADAVQRLAIGTTGQVLTVDTAVDGKVKWAAPAAGSFVGCGLRSTANQTTTGGVDTAVTFDTEYFDSDAFHDNSTNTSRITIPSGKDGKYLFSYAIVNTGAAEANYSKSTVRKNGTEITGIQNLYSSLTYTTMAQTFILDLVATDYIEVYFLSDTGGTIQSYRTFYCQKVG